jgi:dipeptidyl aminopeptidase/acylaminoacyl peptidase
MMSPDGKILDTTTVEPNRHQFNIITKMFDVAVVENTIVEDITYLSDGLKVKGYVARPSAPGVYPTVIWNRGGYRDRGALDDLTAFLILASTAVWGYVVLATQYRGNRGGEGEEDWAGCDLRDAQNMLKVAEQYPECDMERIALEGASRGGMTTYRMLMKDDRFRCAIVHAGIADLPELCSANREFCEDMNRKYADVGAERKMAAMKELSAVYVADRLPKSVPLLLLHGTADTVIPIEQSRRLVAELGRHTIPHEYHEIEGGTHVALKDGSYREIDGFRKEWLERYLL